MPVLSVILPVRNGIVTLSRAVDSCLAGTFKDIEVLVIDDQSSDGTTDWVEQRMRRDTRLRLLHTEKPGGLIPALNLGWQASESPLIARMDADDYSYPERFRKQLVHMHTHRLDLCGTQIRMPEHEHNEGMQDFVDWSNALITPEDHRRERFIESPLIHPTVLMKREILEAIGGYCEMDWPEDYDLWLRFLDAGFDIGKLPEVQLDWHDTPTRLTRSNTRYSQDHFIQCKAHFIAQYAQEEGLGIALCGAGPIGKKMARFLIDDGFSPDAFYEVHPRRIGETIHGIPVRCHTELEAGDVMAVSTVGQPGVRKAMRELMAGKGFVEGENFFCSA